MARNTSCSRLMAALVAAALVLYASPAGSAAPAASLSGTIVAPSGRDLTGTVRVHAGDPKSGSIYSSAPVGPDGSFEIRNLPPSSYELAVEADGGLYVVAAPVALEPGANRTVHLEVKPSAASALSGAKAEEAKKVGRPSVWNNPLTATLIVIGLAVTVGLVVEELTDEEEQPRVSPSTLAP